MYGTLWLYGDNRIKVFTEELAKQKIKQVNLLQVYISQKSKHLRPRNSKQH